ncbi:unnamed protein product, partial [Coregonus sp. 'balchen']
GGANTIAVVCQRKTAITGKRGLLEVLQLDFETKELTEQQLESQMITWRFETGNIKDVGVMRIYTTQRDYVGLTPLVMVSDRCDYVFVNGKETRGRMRMVLNFTYSYLSAQLEMSVWMPRLPLLIDVADPELSQIKGWRVPVAAGNRRYGFAYNTSSPHTDPSDPASDPMVGGVEGSLESFLGPDWQVDVTRLVRYSLRLSPGSNRAIIATTTTQEVMQRPKQEALVSCWVQFSDGSVTPLDLFDRSVYSLTVTSGDKSVATVRRTPQSAFVVAEGEGQGALVKAELRICEECQKSKRKSKLVVGNGLLRVTFQKGSRTDGGGTGGGAAGYGSDGSESEVEPKPVMTSTLELTAVVTSPRALTEGDGDRRSFRSTVPDRQDSTITDVTTSTARAQEVAGGGISTIREGHQQHHHQH